MSVQTQFQEFVEDYAAHLEAGTAGQFFGYTNQKYFELESHAYEFYDRGQYDKAQIILEGVISLDTSRPYPYLLLGDVLMSQKKYDEALEVLNKAHALTPDDIAIKLKLGELYLKTGQNEQAEEVLTHAASMEAPEDQYLKKARVKVLLHNLRTRPLTQEDAP